MTEQRTDDTDVATAIREAAEAVHPGPGLDAIRARTARPAVVRRLRPYALGLAGAAVAASAVAGVLLTGGGEDERPPVAAGEITSEATVYYVGDTGARWGTRVYREHREVTGDPLSAAVSAALGSTVDGDPLAPHDPDYTTPWPQGSTATARVVGTGAERVIEVDLHLSAPALGFQPLAHEPGPELEALVRTAQGAAGEDLAVRVTLDGEPLEAANGYDTSKPVQLPPGFGNLSLVILDAPAEGEVVTDGTLAVTGEASVFEANVLWRITPAAGGKPVLDGFITADGWEFEALTAYEDDLDVSSLAPGEYVLQVTGQGKGTPVDTRTFVVR